MKDLCDIFGGSQANVSGHLKRLVAVGLVAGRRAGRETHYRVADPRLQVVVATATAMAQAASDNAPEEEWARSPTPLLDLLREHSDIITTVHRAAAVLAAMGDPIRLTILMCLASEELRVKDLCAIFGGSQANVSGHVIRLVAVGLVAGRRAGRENHYRVADPRVQVVVATASAMARAASDNDPEEVRARSPTPLLDLLREHSDTITSSREALDAIQLRRLRTSVPARRRSRPQRRG